MGIAFPDKGVGAKNGGEKVAFGATRFEERIFFKFLNSQEDEVIEADGLPDEDPHVLLGE